MKRITALTFLMATLIAMGSARARAQAVELKIPFDFVFDNQTLPAGAYRISRVTEKVILIRSQDGPFYTVAITNADYSQSTEEAVFTRYGNQYFLHKLLFSSAGMYVDLPTSGLEKRARLHGVQLPHGETVVALDTGVK
jgi:hypothetical protein